ncbi:hypothetical protein [Gordonia sp. (in: high G+C Gram-positive bacteria)]|uniref:hypothetical protein n=1 Tax=Gordonia sp. (in: high G+C Gram-positive bacteria) TaxID=84139 RepID=UPI003C720844
MDATDWAQIAVLYQLLETKDPSPVVKLGHAVAVGRSVSVGRSIFEDDYLAAALADCLE